MKRIAVLASLTLLLGLSAAVQARDEGFAGKWVLDKSGQQPPDAPRELETRIKQDHNGITIESTFREPANGVVPLLYLGVMTSTMHLNTDGEETQNKVGPFQVGSKTTMTAPNQMDTDWKGVVNGDAVEGHWTHKLSEDGRHMTLEIRENSTKGQSGQATLYFVRK